MKYIKILISIYVLSFLIACNSDGNESEVLLLLDVEWTELTDDLVIPEPIGTVLEPIIDDLVDELSEIGIVPYLTGVLNDEGIQSLVMIDLLTGEELATYKSAEGQVTSSVGDLGDGYFLASVTPMFWDDDMLDTIFIIFDETLTVVETISFQGEVLPAVYDIVELVDDQVFIYGWGWTGDWEDWTDDTELLRVNIHTGEFEVLFEADLGMLSRAYNLHQFVNGTQILTSSLRTVEETGEFSSHIGILDLELGEFIYELELDSFALGWHIDFYRSKVFFSERRIATGRGRDEVVILDTESWTYQMVSLGVSAEEFLPESSWARLSLDGNHIVTINEEQSAFRKYDMDGVMISEVELEILELGYEGFDMANSFQIFPLTEQIHIIHTESMLGYHIQVIKLP